MSLDVAFEVGRLYVPIKAIADAVSPSWEDVFSRVPGLRAYFPMGAVLSNGNTPDVSGNGIALASTGVPIFDYDGNSYVEVGIATDFLTTLGSQMLVSGTETYMAVALRGLTMGGWIYVPSLPSPAGGIVGLWGASPDFSYVTTLGTGGRVNLRISSNGSNELFVQSEAISVGEWFFWAARFTPSAEIAVFVNGAKSVSTTGVYASLFASSASFEVGRYQTDNTRILNALHRDVFVCSAILSDAQIIDIYNRSMPGV